MCILALSRSLTLEENIYHCCTTNIYSYTEASVSIEGQEGYFITYPSNVDSGTFVVNVYTTSNIATFEVIDADELSGNIYTIFRSHHKYEVIAKYEVRISPLRFYVRNYTIRVSNLDGNFETQKIQVLKADSEHRAINLALALSNIYLFRARRLC